MAELPQGVRLNNPLNMRFNDRDKWQGLMPLEKMNDYQKSKASAWFVFETVPDGFRAASVSMVHAFDFDKAEDLSPINTVAKIVTHWAPPSENDTAAYIAHVCKLTGFGADDVLNFHDWNIIRPIEKAMCIHEQGAWLFEDTDLDTGLRRAGIKEPVASLAQSQTMKTAIPGAALSVASAVEAVQQIKPAIDTISQVKEYWPLAASIVFAVFFAYIVWRRIDDWQHARR